MGQGFLRPNINWINVITFCLLFNRVNSVGNFVQPDAKFRTVLVKIGISDRTCFPNPHLKYHYLCIVVKYPKFLQYIIWNTNHIIWVSGHKNFSFDSAREIYQFYGFVISNILLDEFPPHINFHFLPTCLWLLQFNFQLWRFTCWYLKLVHQLPWQAFPLLLPSIQGDLLSPPRTLLRRPLNHRLHWYT